MPSPRIVTPAEMRQLLMEERRRPSKFGAVKCDRTCGRRGKLAGRPHDSLAECRRWQELALMERAGLIRDLEEQVPFVLAPAAKLFGRRKSPLLYIVDFLYEERCVPEVGCWHQVAEDAKGMQTREFRIKAQLFVTKYRDVELKLS